MISNWIVLSSHELSGFISFENNVMQTVAVIVRIFPLLYLKCMIMIYHFMNSKDKKMLEPLHTTVKKREAWKSKGPCFSELMISQEHKLIQPNPWHFQQHWNSGTYSKDTDNASILLKFSCIPTKSLMWIQEIFLIDESWDIF